MSTINDGGQTEMADLLSYLDSYGSKRLQNCIRQSLSERRMPYATLEEYLGDSLHTRFAKMNRIPNLGKKTATEFNRLAENYSKQASLVVEKKSIESDTQIEQESRGVNPFAAMEIEPTLADRYANLTPREKHVVKRRFAIGKDTKQTLEEIGKDIGVTRERIRQIESKALRKMRIPHIAKSWELYVTENFDQLINAVFGAESLIKRPLRLSGEIALAVAIVYGSSSKFLEKEARRFENYWVKPKFDVLEIQTARNRLAGCLDDDSVLPVSVSEASDALQASGSIVEAAVSAIRGHRIYDGWVIRGNATSRKRRIVNILNLFHKRQIESPASLWDMKVAYWSNYDDKCSGRDLLICLQEHRVHFVNLRELGWVCLTAEPIEECDNSISPKSKMNIPDELYRRPVKAGHGLANCVYELFEKHGPQRLSDAAELFKSEYPQYSVSSMYPMLVYFAVFLRLAPGVIGIQVHSQDADALQSARRIMLREHDLDLYLLSRAAGPPNVRYPLWDLEMELLWASWLVEQGDSRRLGALLSVAKISEWNVTEAERSTWEARKKKLDGRVDTLDMRIFSDRRIDTKILTTALAAASTLGFVNWMYLNQALGWRVETTRVGLVLAVLIRIGALKPTGDWSAPHVLTKVGRQISKSIFGRSILSASEPRKTMADFLVDPTDLQTDTGWAREYNFEQLLNQITDISGQQSDSSGAPSEEESAVAAAYEGFMGEQLRQLIEGE